MSKKIIRSTIDAELRSENVDAGTIHGTPIIFGKRSALLMDYNKWKVVYEIIEPTAITEDVLRNSDIIANLEHNSENMLARSYYGEGSLALKLEAGGVKMSFKAPQTDAGRRALEGVRRGDYKGMSFAYSTDEDVNVTYTKEKDEEGNDVLVRHVNKIDQLYDVSIVAYPAYKDTSVETRGQIEEAVKRALEGGDPTKEPPKQNKQRDEDIDRLRRYIF